jgi:hypothetical protein
MTASAFVQQLGRRLLYICSKPMTAWALIVLFVAFSALRIGLIMEQVIPGPKGQPNAPADFQAYYLDSLSMRLGYGPYTAAFRPEVMQAIADSLHAEQWIMVYYYPPLTAQLILPLTLLPLKVASYTWIGLLTGAAIAAAWLLSKTSPKPYSFIAALLLVLIFIPTGMSILAGQVNMLVLLALTVAFYLASRGHWKGAGASVTIAAMLKIVPGVLIVWLGLTRRWRALAASLLAGLLLVVAALPWGGVTAWTDFLRLFFQYGSTTSLFSFAASESISLAPAINLLVGAGHPAAFVIWRVAVWTMVLITALAVGWRQEHGDWELEFSVMVFLANLFPVYTGYAQACLYLIPFFSLIMRAAHQPNRRWLWPLLAAYAAIEIAWPFGLSGPTTIAISLLLWGGLVGYLLIRKIRRQPTA